MSNQIHHNKDLTPEEKFQRLEQFTSWLNHPYTKIFKHYLEYEADCHLADAEISKSLIISREKLMASAAIRLVIKKLNQPIGIKVESSGSGGNDNSNNIEQQQVN